MRLAGGRLPEGMAGITRFHELVAKHVDDPAQVIIGIKTDRGLWVHALTAAGYQVFAINPRAAARYRERHHLSGPHPQTQAPGLSLLAIVVTGLAVAISLPIIRRSHQIGLGQGRPAS